MKRRILTNAIQKRLSIVGFTVLSILLASVSLYGQPPAGERLVFYLDSNSHLHALFAPNGSGWTDVDITVTDQIPVATGALTSFVDDYDDVWVDYLEDNNQICELVITGISSSGFTGGEFVPTSVSGAPLPASASQLTGLVDSNDNYIHVFYEGTNANVYEFYHSGPGYPPPTITFDDPTSFAKAPVAAYGSGLTSYIDLTSSIHYMHVNYLGTNQNVYELLWDGGTKWYSNDLTSLAGAPVAASGSALTGFIDSTTQYMHVFYLGTNQNVYELVYSGGAIWISYDVTSTAGAPVAASGSALTGFNKLVDVGDWGVHVMYLGTNGHVYALRIAATFSYFDATAASGGGLPPELVHVRIRQLSSARFPA